MDSHGCGFISGTHSIGTLEEASEDGQVGHTLSNVLGPLHKELVDHLNPSKQRRSYDICII